MRKMRANKKYETPIDGFGCKFIARASPRMTKDVLQNSTVLCTAYSKWLDGRTDKLTSHFEERDKDTHPKSKHADGI
jgi:hypothetical protein